MGEAVQLREQTKADDEAQLQTLQSAAAEKAKSVANRKIVVTVLAARLEECKTAARKASANYTSAAFVHKTLLDLELEQQKALDALTKSLGDCAAKLATAREA